MVVVHSKTLESQSGAGNPRELQEFYTGIRKKEAQQRDASAAGQINLPSRVRANQASGESSLLPCSFMCVAPRSCGTHLRVGFLTPNDPVKKIAHRHVQFLGF